MKPRRTSKKMQQFNSATRELLTACGAAAVQFGLMKGDVAATVGGAALALAMVLWAIRNHAGAGVLGTLIRKLVSSAAGVAATYGVLTPEKLEAISGVVLVVVTLYCGSSKALNAKEDQES